MARLSRINVFTEPAIRDSPMVLDQAQVEPLVEKYRAGDDSVRDELIRLHLRTVAMSALRFARDHKCMESSDELLQEALSCLVELVVSAQSRLKTNSITDYIMASLRLMLREFVGRSRSVYMPPRTFRHLLSLGREIKGVEFKTHHHYPMTQSELSYDAVGDEARRFNHQQETLISPGEDTSIEFEEALERAMRSDEDRLLVNLRLQGCTIRQISDKTGLERCHVSRSIKRIQKRFDNYFL